MKKKLLAGVLTVCMLVSLTPQVLYAETGDSEANVVPAEISINIPEVEDYGPGPYYQVPFGFGEETADLPVLYSTEIPSSYDSRDLLPEARNQGAYGTCWTFAAMAAAESSMIYRQEQVDGAVADSTINLSEYQLARFQYFNVDDPLNNTTGDQTIAICDGVDITGTEDVSAVSSYLNRGGSQVYATWSMAGWKAGADETTASYDTIASTSGVLEDSVAYADKVHMQNAYWLPMSEPDVIKAMIMEHGTLGSSYISGDSGYTYSTDANTNTNNCAYYSGLTQEEAAVTEGYYGHGIAIVGWDDDYSVENFNADCQPTSNGAWLVRNSWGSDWADGGYFWISYEELTLDNMAFAYEFEDADNYDYNYQYDGSSGIGEMTCETKASYANVFEVKGEGNQVLEAVGIGVSSSGVSYELQIYKDPQEGVPNSGTPMLEEAQTGEFLYPGYYTVELDELVYLEQGHSFSVVFTLSEGAEIFIDMTYDGGWVRFVNNTELNQSFMYTDGGCLDFGSEGWECCARIKAYTNKAENLTTEITKAEPGKDGSINQSYEGQIITSEAISAPERLELSASVFNCDGNTYYPEVTGVYDANGEIIAAENYDISYRNKESAEPGTYSVTVTFKGEYYTGSLTENYTIQEAATEPTPDDLTTPGGSQTTTPGGSQTTTPGGSQTTTPGGDQTTTPDVSEVTAPGKVHSLKTTSQNTTTIKLSWSKVSDASGYEIYKYNTSTKKWQKLATVDSNTTKYTSKKLKVATKQQYKVRAYKQNGSDVVYGEYSKVLTTYTKPAKVTKVKASVGTGQVKLSWKKAKGASGYQIFVYNKAKKKYVKIATIKKAKTVSKKLTSSKPGTTYKYKVRAYKKVGKKYIYGSFSSVKVVKTKK